MPAQSPAGPELVADPGQLTIHNTLPSTHRECEEGDEEGAEGEEHEQEEEQAQRVARPARQAGRWGDSAV